MVYFTENVLGRKEDGACLSLGENTIVREIKYLYANVKEEGQRINIIPNSKPKFSMLNLVISMFVWLPALLNFAFRYCLVCDPSKPVATIQQCLALKDAQKFGHSGWIWKVCELINIKRRHKAWEHEKALKSVIIVAQWLSDLHFARFDSSLNRDCSNWRSQRLFMRPLRCDLSSYILRI